MPRRRDRGSPLGNICNIQDLAFVSILSECPYDHETHDSVRACTDGDGGGERQWAPRASAAMIGLRAESVRYETVPHLETWRGHMRLVLYATLREIVGHSEVVVPLPQDRDLLVCLNDLANQYGTEWRDTVLDEGGGISEYVRIYVNGKEVHKTDRVVVADKDDVEILVPVAGG